MKGVLFIPYGNGDAVRGFKYDKPLTSTQFVKMETKEYEDHKDGVDHMMYTRYGDNMAINMFQKRKFKYTQQKYDFDECSCMVLNMNGKPQDYNEILNHIKSGEQFILILNLKAKELEEQPNLESTLKQWFSDSMKVRNCNRLSDIEVMKHLPKKDFKLYIEEQNKMVVLKDCKFVKLMSSSAINSFAVIVNKVVFINE